MEPITKSKKKIYLALARLRPWPYLITLAVLVFLAVGAVFFFSADKAEKTVGEFEVFQELPPVEVFSLASVISRIDREKKLIFVQHPTEAKEIKIMIGEETQIVKLEFPFDPANPPKGETTFSPQFVKITIDDLKPGDHTLIESGENIYQKLEFNQVKNIQVLP